MLQAIEFGLRCSVTFDRLTMIVGANGCGKTSLLRAIDSANRARRDGIHHPPWPTTDPDPDCSRGRVTLDDCTAIYRYQLDADRVAEGPTTAERSSNMIEDCGPSTCSARWWTVPLDCVGYRGEWTTRALLDPVLMRTVEPELARLVPGLMSMSFAAADHHGRREPLTLWMGNRRSDSCGSTPLPIKEAGAGIALLLATLTAVNAPAQYNRTTLLFDNIDRNLHPSAQRGLMVCLRAALARRPALQIIATTHSPYMLDAATIDEVRVMRRDSSGQSRAASLASHPEAERWRGKMAAGEFWSNVGDDWIEELQAPVREHHVAPWGMTL